MADNPTDESGIFDITTKESVEQIDESRYIISTEPGVSPTVPDSKEKVEELLDEKEDKYKIFLRSSIDGNETYYVIEEGSAINAFDELLIWYGIQIKHSRNMDMPVHEIINNLIKQSELMETQ